MTSYVFSDRDARCGGAKHDCCIKSIHMHVAAVSESITVLPRLSDGSLNLVQEDERLAEARPEDIYHSPVHEQALQINIKRRSKTFIAYRFFTFDQMTIIIVVNSTSTALILIESILMMIKSHIMLIVDCFVILFFKPKFHTALHLLRANTLPVKIHIYQEALFIVIKIRGDR